MKPGERVAVIKRIATRMAADADWAEIDLVLEQFGFQTEWQWDGDFKSYVLNCVKSDTDAKLLALDQYLSGHTRPDEEPWEDGRFRLFITHLAKHKGAAHAIKSHLRFYGIDAFVAHDDIPPGKDWQLVIESALHSCDALVALLHDGFRESDWCDQEVGFALGRGVPAVPIHFDLYPYGFFGSLQAVINASSKEVKALAKELTLILLHDKRTAERLTSAIVEALLDAGSFDQAKRLSGLLANEAPLLTKDQVDRLRLAEKTNRQLTGAYGFDANISTIEAKLRATMPPAPSLDLDEPF